MALLHDQSGVTLRCAICLHVLAVLNDHADVRRLLPHRSWLWRLTIFCLLAHFPSATQPINWVCKGVSWVVMSYVAKSLVRNVAIHFYCIHFISTHSIQSQMCLYRKPVCKYCCMILWFWGVTVLQIWVHFASTIACTNPWQKHTCVVTRGTVVMLVQYSTNWKRGWEGWSASNQISSSHPV